MARNAPISSASDRPRRGTAGAAPPAESSRLAALAIAGACLALAAGVRAFHIASKDVWIDEANAAIIASASPAEIVARLRLDSSPPLYYFLLHFWMRMFGDSEAALRSLSAVFGVLLVGETFWVARRWFGLRVAAIAGVVAALAPIQVLYAQEMRMYTLLPLAALGAFAFACELADRGGWLAALGTALFVSLTLYTHNYGVFLLPALAIVALASGTFRARLRQWLVVGAAVALAYAPWMPVFVAQLRNEGQYAWLAPFWTALGAGHFLAETAQTFVVGVGGFAHIGATRPPECAALTILVWAFVAFAIARAAWDPGARRHMLRLAVFLVVPLAAAFGRSLAGSPCYVCGRCDQLVFPAFVLILAGAVGSLKRPLARTSATAIVASASVAMLAIYFGLNAKAGDRDIAEAVVRTARPGEAVLCTSLTRASIEYYARLEGKPLALRSFPDSTALHLGNQDDRELLAHPEALREEAKRVLDEIRRESGPDGTFLLVTTQKPVNESLLATLRDLHHANEVKFVGDCGTFRQSLVANTVRVMHYRFVPPGSETGDAGRDGAALDLLASILDD
jgi:mannosyltransferase